MEETRSNILSLSQMVPDLRTANLATNNTTYVGIDFGTSTTVVSVAGFDVNSKKLAVKSMMIEQLLEDETHFQSEKVPSVLAWYNNKLLVGEGAANLKYTLQRGKNIWYSFKMEIGEDLGAKYYNSELGAREGVKIRNPKDCVRMFFMFLKAQIEKNCDKNGLSKNIKYAVSIPASFEANQRKELLEALETNGMVLTKQSLIDEPNAAFISYIQESFTTGSPLLISPHYNTKVLVFDFGAGTCDISILEIGKSITGIYSKNIAISQFTELGGDDVDRYITFHYILPRFLAYNDAKESDFLTKERKAIATQLYKVSEQLKILTCKSIMPLVDNFKIPDSVRMSDKEIKIIVPVEIGTTKGVLKQENFFLRYSEMAETMKVFTKQANKGRMSNTLKKVSTTIKGEKEYNSIFFNIESALFKANCDTEDIDYVLFIGGSAQNPFIQEAVKEYFPESKMLLPRDLQTHVSQGAAIHSLFMNGMDRCIIRPITSESIFIITKDTERKILVPAGTVVPTDTVIIDDLETIREKQNVIELPICVGSENKMLFNLKITPQQIDGFFPLKSKVSVACEITADKSLIVHAQCMGVDCRTEPLSPFANKELTTEERVVLKAERQANLEAEKNGGKVTQQSLESLRTAYEKAGRNFDAAETYEQQYKMYPKSVVVNNIGVLYSNAGLKDKAVEFYKLALEGSPNDAVTCCNIGYTLLNIDREEALKYIRKSLDINPNHCPALSLLADEEERHGNKEKAKEMRQKAYDIYMDKWKNNRLRDCEYSWFSSLAQDLKHYEVARDIIDSKERHKNDDYFREENLVRTKALEIDNL